MAIQLSDHFTYRRLFRFTLPSIVMMVFTSIYSIVDGLFVSNLVGKTSFAAINFIFPFLMILGAMGFMFGAGGSALVSKTMGAGDHQKAQELFSLIVYVTAGASLIIMVVSMLFLRPIAILMGAEGTMLDDCVTYGRLLLPALPFYMFQFEFQTFFITAEKPSLGLVMTVLSGVLNMVLDALFMAVFHWGLEGAALATAISQSIGGLFGLLYFALPNSGLLRLRSTRMDIRALLKACSNGSSELMSNVSMSLVSMLYNIQLIRCAGEGGIAAYGVIMYVNMIFLSIYIGYSTGVAPVVGFHFGANDHAELKNLLRKSLVIIGSFSVTMLALAVVLARPLAAIFVSYDADLLALTVRGFTIYALSFLFSGFAIFGSAFFTALNDGLTSALISFLRSLVFQTAAVLILPIFWGIDGIWISIVAAELVAALATLLFLVGKRKHYHY